MNAAPQKLKRLCAMTPHEVAHRVREKLHAELDRLRTGHGRPAVGVSIDFKNYLAGSPRLRFYRGPRENPRAFFANTLPQVIDRAVAEAEGLCRHEVQLLGHPHVVLGEKINWHRDPLTGRIWERRYWADYRPVSDCPGRDVKNIHELNRHQHLPRLAKAYLLTGDERYARESVAQLLSWIEQNPHGLGINWQSSLEIGIRAISWLWTIFLLLPSRSLDEASAQRIGESLFDQLEHVCRYTSLYSSPNTHLIGEAAALFIAGLVFRDQPRPALWLERGAALLTQEAGRQVLDDGVHGELSSYYHCYALDFYLQALGLAAQNQFRLPRRLRHRVCGMLQFLMHLTRPDGTVPLLGDDDGGRALALDKPNYRSFQDALCLGAILYRRGDFKQQAGDFAEETFWLLGRDAWETYCQLDCACPAETLVRLPRAGYSFQRSGWGALDSHLVFDCGGLGMLSGGHAHADALSLTLFSRGRQLLVDPGTFVYNGAAEWRAYFRSTRAHNTVTIDGRDQAEPAGTFCWKRKLRPRASREFAAAAIEYLEGEHDGYLRWPQGIIHRRRLLYVRTGYWIVVDDFRGAGKHRFDFHYHLAPDVELSSLEHDGTGLVLRAEQAGLLLGLYASLPFTTTEIVCGATQPVAGWVSAGYGEKKPCPALRATLHAAAPAAAMTFLAPSRDGQQDAAVRRLSLESGSGIACAYRHHGFEDIAVLSTSSAPVSVAGIRMNGEFFWLRLEDGLLKQVFAIRASGLDLHGTCVFRRSEPTTYFDEIDTRSKEEILCAESVGS